MDARNEEDKAKKRLDFPSPPTHRGFTPEK